MVFKRDKVVSRIHGILERQSRVKNSWYFRETKQGQEFMVF